MESQVFYYHNNDGGRLKYTNLYYINNKFYFLTIDKDIKLPKLLKYEYFVPDILVFKDEEEIRNYVNKYKIAEIIDTTCNLSHYYDWNVGHGLYDSLYPIYLLYLKFYDYKEDGNIDNLFNIFIHLKYIQGWRFPGIASRDWVLDIFEKFCKGRLIRENSNDNFVFREFLCGQALSGISSVNDKCEMPGKDNRVLERFRNRMLRIYNIPKYLVSNNKKNLNIIFIDSDRYNPEDRIILSKLVDKLKIDHNCKMIFWKNIPIFEEQLKLMNETDILITGSGTSMMNFPFLRNDSILINLGANEVGDEYKVPSSMEVNICLLANYIRVYFYDIFHHKKIKYNELDNIIYDKITKYINGTHEKTEIPRFIRIWRLYFNADKKNKKELLEKMNGIRQPHLMGYRWPEILVNECKPFDKDSNLIDNKLLKSLKEYPKNIFQIYHDKALISSHVREHIERLNPGYLYRIINFEEGKKIIKENLDELLAERICISLDKMPRYCHRSDLLRYCLLYIYGGIYLDVDLKPTIPFNQIIKSNTDLITCFGSGGDKVEGFEFKGRNKKLQQIMANGLFASKKGNILLLDLIEYSINNIHKPDILNHGNNVRWLFKYLENKCKENEQQIQPFKELIIDNYSIYLYCEDLRGKVHYMIDENFDIIVDPCDPNYNFVKQS